MSIPSDDINDVFDGLREERPQDIASNNNDSNLGSSLSNFGIDRDNPEENLRYIQQNQDPQAIIQGIGVAARNPDGSENFDSGLATSVSRTVSGEFIHEVINFQEVVSDNNSELNAAVEPQPGPSSGVRYGYDPQYDESEKLAENLQELDILSSFDLALGKGYREQAKIYYDDATSKGLRPETSHIKPIKIIGSKVMDRDESNEFVGEGVEELDELWSEGYVLQRTFNLIKDFEEYLERLQKKEFKKVLEILNYKKELNENEKQIKINIATKAKRNNVTLQRETMTMIRNFIERLKLLEVSIKELIQSTKKDEDSNKEKREEPSEGGKHDKDNEKKDNNDFDKDGATGLLQSLA